MNTPQRREVALRLAIESMSEDDRRNGDNILRRAGRFDAFLREGQIEDVE